MPVKLRERLRAIIDQTTSIPSVVGFTTLALIALALPDLRDWPKLLAQFDTLQAAITFFLPKIAPFLLICTTIFWYYRYKNAVINELNQINETFEEGQSPRYFGNIEGHKLIPYIGYLLVLTYIALVLAAPYIWLYCLIALVLHVTDVTGSALTLQNLNKTFGSFSISSKQPDAPFIAERREVLRQYYFEHPTLPRIGGLLFVTACAFVLSLVLPPRLPAIVYYCPYAIMIANILVGELIIQRWRSDRDRKLDDITSREEQAARANGNTFSG